MGLNLNFGAVKEKIILISIDDDSIDWEASSFKDEYTDPEGKSFVGVEAKKAQYKKDYDVSKLAFDAQKKPTCFVFKNPERYEIGTKLTDIFVSCSGIVTKKEPIISDINKRIWNQFFVGYFDGKPEEFNSNDTVTFLQKPFVNGNIKEDFLQAIYQVTVLDEMSNALQSRKKN